MKNAKHKPSVSEDIERHQKQLAHIRRRYGTSAMTVTFEMYVTSDELCELYGKECEKYVPGCCVCENWLLYCRTGRGEFTLPRKDIIKLLLAEGAMKTKKTKQAPPASGDIEKQRKKLAHIRRRYGTTAMTVPFEMYVTDDEMAELYGEQCEEYEPGCCVCKNWMLYCRTGRAEFTLQREEIIKVFRAAGKR